MRLSKTKPLVAALISVPVTLFLGWLGGENYTDIHRGPALLTGTLFVLGIALVVFVLAWLGSPDRR